MKKTLILAVGTVIATVLIWLAFKPRRETTAMEAASAQEAVGSVDQPEPVALPVPSVIPPLTASTWPEEAPPPTVVQRIARNDATVLKLAPEQIQAFLARNKTNAESLLA